MEWRSDRRRGDEGDDRRHDHPDHGDIVERRMPRRGQERSQETGEVAAVHRRKHRVHDQVQHREQTGPETRKHDTRNERPLLDPHRSRSMPPGIMGAVSAATTASGRRDGPALTNAPRPAPAHSGSGRAGSPRRRSAADPAPWPPRTASRRKRECGTQFAYVFRATAPGLGGPSGGWCTATGLGVPGSVRSR
jgi:hypothetical protein